MKSFVEHLKEAVVSMWHKAPAIAVWIASAINQLVPVIEELDSLALDPAEAAVVNALLDKIKVGLAALKVTVQGVGSSVNAKAILASVTSNLDALEQAAEIKNPETKATIARVVGVVRAEVATIGAVLPTAV